ncbi:D-tyrosyl-tRNA(Tyr) deacylase [Candidatus Woesebacteria bacterium]|nr:D-tyrosyl-tRNA(Tyr) deacylase [Candidatus Woesebacteria bacterium]
MISLIQRVTQASVKVDGILISSISAGYVILVGIFEQDTPADVEKSVQKIATLRIMSDDQDKMNRSIIDSHGEILLVSQFTLCADLSGGRRPSFVTAKKPDEARILYENMITLLRKEGITVKTGQFGEYMDVEIRNDGPVTVIVDSKMI